MKFNLYSPLAIQELGKRANQEDSIYPLYGDANKGNRLFIVCDGMGGHEHGEVASLTVCQALANYFNEKICSSSVLEDNTFYDALEYAYQELDKKDDGGLKKMGTTLTLLYLHKGGATCAHIGDSRIYHIRPGKGLLYASRDHSLVFDLYQSGEISYEEMKTSPQKNVILRAMQPGEDKRTRADIIHISDIQPGDFFYLCTDGMLEEMDNNEIYNLFNSDGSDETKLQKLIKETSENRDNHSAYLIHIESITKEAGDEHFVNEEPISRCNALNIIPIIPNIKNNDGEDTDDGLTFAGFEEEMYQKEIPEPQEQNNEERQENITEAEMSKATQDIERETNKKFSIVHAAIVATPILLLAFLVVFMISTFTSKENSSKKSVGDSVRMEKVITPVKQTEKSDREGKEEKVKETKDTVKNNPIHSIREKISQRTIIQDQKGKD